MSGLDLAKYFALFDDALEERYKDKFRPGRARIEALYLEVRSGRDITVDDVLAIFENDLPYVQDWTRPDRKDLARRMEANDAGKLIKRLADTDYDRKWIGGICYCFRELSLTALVLHHVYPQHFAMCSHHLASLLFVTAPTLPEFYVDYCKELRVWGQLVGPSRSKLTVVETEFALWTWYRLAYHSRTSDARRKHFRTFFKDPWVQERRARRIAYSLKDVEKLDLARSYLDTEPTVAAIIAWREFEAELRQLLGDFGNIDIKDLIYNKVKPEALPRGWTNDDLMRLWSWTGPGRNWVMHRGAEITSEDAASVLDQVTAFIEHNTSGSRGGG